MHDSENVSGLNFKPKLYNLILVVEYFVCLLRYIVKYIESIKRIDVDMSSDK